MNYRFAYSIGFHPWEDAASDPPFVEKASQLFDREEQGREMPFGRALDIGTGSGIWGIELAKRGWDVTALSESSVGSGFRLILDTGTFHDFDADQRMAMGKGVEAKLSQP